MPKVTEVPSPLVLVSGIYPFGFTLVAGRVEVVGAEQRESDIVATLKFTGRSLFTLRKIDRVRQVRGSLVWKSRWFQYPEGQECESYWQDQLDCLLVRYAWARSDGSSCGFLRAIGEADTGGIRQRKEAR